MTLYTVWHQVVPVTNEDISREKQWLRENITGFKFHKELSANTSYMFAVTAWNRWGESSLKIEKTLFISTDFPVRATAKETDKTAVLFYTGGKRLNWMMVENARL